MIGTIVRLAAVSVALAVTPAFAGEGELISPGLSLEAWGNGRAFSPAPGSTVPALRLTFYWENDGGFAKPFQRHDRHYTSGQGASLAWRAPWVDAMLSRVPSFGNEFPAEGSSYAMGFVGAINLYTPEEIADPEPIVHDRPYAGWTWAGLFAQRANYRAALPSYESLEFDLGIVGPSSLAQNAQEMIHHEFNYTYPRGWRNQIHDEPEFSIKYEHRWRILRQVLVRTSEKSGVFGDILPDVGVTAGSLRDELRAGIVFRLILLDDRLPDDFGPGTLDRPADFTFAPARRSSGDGLADFVRHQSVYVFARPYGRIVAHDVLMQGDNWRHDDPVTLNPRPLVGGVQVGIVHRVLNCFEFSYTTTWESDQFAGQRGADTWSSLQAAFFFNF